MAERGHGLVHQALFYESTDDFVRAAAPLVRAGLEVGDSVLAATTPANVAALREELGDVDGDFALHDTGEWCVHPYDRLQETRRMVAELPAGRTLRTMGEPIWSGSPAVIREWARYESVINDALADAPTVFTCLYDGGSLPDPVLEYAIHTHPERVEDGSAVPCPDYVPPAEFSPGPPAQPPADATTLQLEIEGPALRTAVGDFALRAGYSRDRVDGFVLAAWEVARTLVERGEAPFEARIWACEDEMACQISDHGPATLDPLAGWVPPASAGMEGWELPIARRLADAMEIVPGEDGTTVALYLSKDP